MAAVERPSVERMSLRVEDVGAGVEHASPASHTMRDSRHHLRTVDEVLRVKQKIQIPKKK